MNKTDNFLKHILVASKELKQNKLNNKGAAFRPIALIKSDLKKVSGSGHNSDHSQCAVR